MGCDIHCFVEKKQNNQWSLIEGLTYNASGYDSNEPFDWRSYRIFGFFAGVRNYSDITPLAPRRGMPENLSEELKANHHDWQWDAHSHSWFLLRELLDCDYEQIVEDRRVSREIKTTNGSYIDGGCTAEPGGGETMTLREFLGDMYFAQLEELKALGNPDEIRIVFWFDN